MIFGSRGAKSQMEMLNFFRFVLFLLITFQYRISSAQNVPMGSDADCAEITLSTDTINLEKVIQHSETMHTIAIMNSGKCPLIITSIKAAMECRYKCEKNLLQPGDSCHLIVYFSAHEPGGVSKSLSIFSNAKVAEKNLTIKGWVEEEKRCTTMSFDHDTLDLGNIPYVIGKHFFVHVTNHGLCNMTFAVLLEREQYLNILDYTHDTIKPADTGKIGIHIGGQLTGNYYGKISVRSDNANPGEKTVFMKGHFLPPAAKDSNDAAIEVSQDFFDFKTIHYSGSTPVRTLSGEIEITNRGKKTLVVIQNDPYLMAISTPATPVRLLPGGSAKMTIHFYYIGAFPAKGEVLVHTLISGNFNGKNMPIYAKWKYEK